MDRRVFYAGVREKLGALKQDQVDGFERYLDEGERRGTPLDRLAYIIATVFWETARTMQPVKEAFWKNEAWRQANLRYFPWYGRGDVQLTWEENYRKAGTAIGEDLIKNPDAALLPANAVKIAFEGMEKGWFTGKSLSDYLDGVDESDDEDLREFANARRVVNGTDKQIEIGKLALVFEHGLRDAGYSGMPSRNPIVLPESIILPEAAPLPSPAPAPIGHNGGPVLEPAAPSKPLTPIEQMNKPVQGAKAGAASASVGGAIVLLASSAGWLPQAWQSGEAAIALGLVAGTLSTAIGNFIGAYLAHDLRFMPKKADTA
ncbi:glycoside hydrolase family 19 protein [Tianweitania sp.]|uniref:glycoside hydrolase family 19 protein n=1 Tax=Tianweitania sp. TaxID=2021634 RepID=UPI002896CE7E|nr:glycoside hydrolase family 19 protein [Tianweitania sp.]